MSNVFKIRRNKRFFIKFIASFVALSGVWASIVGLSPITLNPLEFWVSLITITLISVIYGVLSVSKVAFPTDEVIPYDLSSKRSRIAFPCTEEQYKIANKIANDSFTKKDSLNFRKIKAWQQKNPYVLSLYYDSNNKVMGYFDVLPLYADFEQKLRDGGLTEQAIDYDSLKSPEEMYHSDIIYIGGIAVLDMDNKCRSFHAGLLLHALISYLKTFYSFEKTTTISATAATKCGEDLLNKLGFSLYKEGSFRSDGHNYYVKEVASKDIKALEREFGNKDRRLDCSAYKTFINSDKGKQITS
jgi:hypothetical protein